VLFAVQLLFDQLHASRNRCHLPQCNHGARCDLSRQSGAELELMVRASVRRGRSPPNLKLPTYNEK
jgi:hypothetical protein